MLALGNDFEIYLGTHVGDVQVCEKTIPKDRDILSE